MLSQLPNIPRLEPSSVQFTPPDHPINPDKVDGFRVMLARFPGNNQEHPDSSGYLMKILPSILRDNRIDEVVPFRKAGTPIPVVRNHCVQEAIGKECDYILMIDNDMSPDCEPDGYPFWPTAWEFMMRRRKRESSNQGHEWEHYWRYFPPCAVAAPYCGHPPDEKVYVMRWLELEGSEDPDRHFKMANIDRHDAARRTGIGTVAAAPTGLILYDTRMFYYLPPPWFDYEYGDAYQSRLVSTEDVYQTRNAALLGMPVYVAWDCWAGHWKPKLVRKPAPVSVETVKGSIREAFEKGITSRQKLHFAHRDAPS